MTLQDETLDASKNIAPLNSTSSTLSNRSQNTLLSFVKELRPIQWSKNGLLFAALLFTIPHVTVNMLLRDILAFLLFSFVSGCVYILNDLVDLESDRHNPEKQHRPLAAGLLRPRTAAIFGSVLFVVALTLGFKLSMTFAFTLVTYVAVNVAYSLWIKNQAILDIFAIAAGFVLRAAAGGFAISVTLTPWFLCCAMVLSLFLATGKRKYEYMVWQRDNRLFRKVLLQYSPELLNQLSSVTAASVIMTYAMFTFSPGHTRYLMLTIPLVMYGVFRYFQLMYMENQGGRPELTLIRDKHILGTVMVFTVLVGTLLYTYG